MAVSVNAFLYGAMPEVVPPALKYSCLIALPCSLQMNAGHGVGKPMQKTLDEATDMMGCVQPWIQRRGVLSGRCFIGVKNI